MPGGDRNLTLAYAGAASLAAITLVYVFGPSFFIDSSKTSSSQRRNGVVGLVNPANDCFINSVLQALAGLPELREYLVHRTRIANDIAVANPEKPPPLLLSSALKSILDSLNERPIRRKAISARPFLIALENIFQQKISRAQQDAQEFLQVVAERLAEEYHSMERPLRRVDQARVVTEQLERESGAEEKIILLNGQPEKLDSEDPQTSDLEYFEERGMPLEGSLESDIECTVCRYRTKPNRSKFVVLTLPVPHKPTATLSECFDKILTTEHIDDFQCDNCRLQHAIAYYEKKCNLVTTSSTKKEYQNILNRLQELTVEEPIPADIQVPPAPRSRIAKRTRISQFPSIIVIHLSRSIYDQVFSSRKNICKVSFPEVLPLGGLIDRRWYKLLCVVTHKGGHDSGHYECFRRQVVYPAPYSTPHPPTASTSPISTPTISVSPSRSVTPPEFETVHLNGKEKLPIGGNGDAKLPPSRSSTPTLPSSLSPTAGIPSEADAAHPDRPASPASMKSSASTSSKSATVTNSLPVPTSQTNGNGNGNGSSRKPGKKPKKNNKWWRISDDKIKEAKTEDVLQQQKEVYMLFYERVREEKG